MVTERFANEWAGALNAAVVTAPAAGTVETWTLVTTAGLPTTAGVIRLRVDDEYVLATTPALSGTTLAVVRGSEGTIATHASAAAVRAIVTAGAFDALVQGGFKVYAQDADPGGNNGDWWLDTDEEPALTAGLVLIGDQTLAVAAATIDFANIPATFRELRLVFQGRTNRAGQTTDLIGLRINNDSGANYRAPYVKGSGAAASSAVDTTSSSAPIGFCPGATGTAGTPGQAEAKLVNYAGLVFHKTVIAESGSTDGAFEEARLSYARWANTAAINQLTLISLNAASFIAGSRATLYGVK